MESQCVTQSTRAEARGPSLDARHRWKVLAVGVSANASFSAAATGIPTTAVWMRASYHFGNAELGVALGAMGFGLAISELPWGVATDRLGDRPVLVTGLLATALTLIAMAFFTVPSGNGVPALSLLAGAMCVVGLCGGSVNGSSGRAVMSWFKEGERGLAMSIRQTAVPLGGALGALILPWLASRHGFASVFVVLAALCALSAIAALRWLRSPPASMAPSHTHRDQASRGPLTDSAVWRVALGIGILCVPQFAVLTFATVFLHDFGHVGTVGISATMTAIQTGAMGMRVWSGRHTDRWGNRRAYLRRSTLVVAVSFAALASAVALGHIAPVALVLGTTIVAGICVSAWHGVAYTELATLAGPARAGTALGMANTVVYAGLFFAPTIIPYLLAVCSWAGVWLIAGLVALITYPLFPHPEPVRARLREA